MIVRKVCLMGAFAVGKTSLVRRFVHQVFNKTYKTTLGVSIENKMVDLSGEMIKMVIWDFEGQHPANSESIEYSSRMRSYVKGAAGILLVADGTRPWTLESAVEMHAKYLDSNPGTPYILLVNKSDLVDQWQVGNERLEMLKSSFRYYETSAQSGKNVDLAFRELAGELVGTP